MKKKAELRVAIGVLFVGWALLCTWAFNKYAYEITEFNAKVRVFLTHQKTTLREFINGIPVTYSPKNGVVVSPFYVVHYGILFSERFMEGGVHWNEQETLAHWNVMPDSAQLKEKEFYITAAAKWLLHENRKLQGKTHYIYDFDWHYENHPNNELGAPWWSGLADAYSLILLLRAYDISQNEDYLNLASSIYQAVTSSVEEFGSLNRLNGCPWVEEYVDPRVVPSDLSHVLNGAVYAAHGIEAYERFTLANANSMLAPKLYNCIEENLSLFDAGIWSYYDAIGTSANIKYHRINYFLVKDLLDRGKIVGGDATLDVLRGWRIGVNNPGFGFLMKGPVTFGYFHFIASYLMVLFLFPVGLHVWRYIGAKQG